MTPEAVQRVLYAKAEGNGVTGYVAATGKSCRCTPDAVARYQGRLSGPLLDRIDLQVEVPAVKSAELLGLPDGEPSSAVAERVKRDFNEGIRAGVTATPKVFEVD